VLLAKKKKKKKRGYTVCTSDYVATNTQKTKEGCKKISGKQAVTQRRPTPSKPLCARHDTWPCRQNRRSLHMQCRLYAGNTADRPVQTVSVTENHTLCSIVGRRRGVTWCIVGVLLAVAALLIHHTSVLS
jgi:hypothetical protein